MREGLPKTPRRFRITGPGSRDREAGVQLVELLLAVAIVAVVAAIAVPSYSRYRDRANNAAAMADIASIAEAIERFYVANDRYPDSLADIGMHALRDSWNNPYRYLRINGAGLKGKGGLRKDKALVPVNSDFDLYSMGKDGITTPAFTANNSRDDVVRANNGRYIGLAADY